MGVKSGMAKFTCTMHGDQANGLVKYWSNQHKKQRKAKQWFMAAVSLGCLLEAMLYGYFIVWSGDDDPAKDEQIPDDAAESRALSKPFIRHVLRTEN